MKISNNRVDAIDFLYQTLGVLVSPGIEPGAFLKTAVPMLVKDKAAGKGGKKVSLRQLGTSGDCTLMASRSGSVIISSGLAVEPAEGLQVISMSDKSVPSEGLWLLSVEAPFLYMIKKKADIPLSSITVSQSLFGARLCLAAGPVAFDLAQQRLLAKRIVEAGAEKSFRSFIGYLFRCRELSRHSGYSDQSLKIAIEQRDKILAKHPGLDKLMDFLLSPGGSETYKILCMLVDAVVYLKKREAHV